MTTRNRFSLNGFAKLIGLLLAITLIAAACGADTNTTPAQSEVASEGTDDSEGEEQAEDSAEAEEAEEPAEDETEEEPADDAEEEVAEEEVVEQVEEEQAVEADELVIVSMSPTATEMLFAIGAGDFVVAADDNSNFPPEAPTDPELTNFPVNVEGIISFEPTLVVSSGAIEGLDAVGIENLVLPFAATFDDTYSQIEQLGAATGRVGEAAELVSQIQTDLATISASVEIPETPITFYHELDNTLFSLTSETFAGQVYDLFGLENVADAADPDGEAFGFPQLNEEFVLVTNPDFIFLADTVCCAQTAETIATRPGWDQLRAVESGNVVELDDDIASRWGPRIVDFAAVVAEAIFSVQTAEAN